MKVRSAAPVFAALLAAALAALSCGKREGTSPLFVLEELEAASAVKDSLDRLARLEIFIRNNRSHIYRGVAYERVFETMAERLGDAGGAMRFLRESLSDEEDPAMRGALQLLKFRYLFGTDRAAALAFADTLAASERSPRLFMMMGYYCMDPSVDPARATALFLRAADLSRGDHERSQAYAMAGAMLEERGERGEAKRYLSMAAGNPEADRALGEILWAEGKREEAIDLLVACVARMPGTRAAVKLDSLHALVRSGTRDLDERIMAVRVGDEGLLPEASFVDLEGRRHDLATLRGTKLVIYALSPT
jgi:tetratricopeptide (TPR) repeat protein